MKNYWHEQQEKTKKGTFAPKWSEKTVEWIISELKESDKLDIVVSLCRSYNISVATANIWIKMSKRIQKDLESGASLKAAIELDKQRRNKKRRKKDDSN